MKEGGRDLNGLAYGSLDMLKTNPGRFARISRIIGRFFFDRFSRIALAGHYE
jgi:hypothetical protein